MAAANQPDADQEAAYTRTITERADKIVDSLGSVNPTAAMRVRDIIVRHYRNLREIHDTRDARLDEVKKSPAGDPVIAEAWIKATRNQANLQLVEAHRQFLARLLVELTPKQVDKVKDAMTYGVVQVTYNRYLELLPALTDEQKREILANLLEAREYAMDAGSSDEKHAVFNQYKGRINNYLSAAGFDLKQAEKELSSKQSDAPQTR